MAALLAEVDAAVAAKKAQGFYDPAEVRRVEEAAVTLQADPDAESMERLPSYLRETLGRQGLRRQHPPPGARRAGWWSAASG